MWWRVEPSKQSTRGPRSCEEEERKERLRVKETEDVAYAKVAVYPEDMKRLIGQRKGWKERGGTLPYGATSLKKLKLLDDQ